MIAPAAPMRSRRTPRSGAAAAGVSPVACAFGSVVPLGALAAACPLPAGDGADDPSAVNPVEAGEGDAGPDTVAVGDATPVPGTPPVGPAVGAAVGTRVAVGFGVARGVGAGVGFGVVFGVGLGFGVGFGVG